MTTTFEKGSIVTATASINGLTKGAAYVVVDKVSQPSVLGAFEALLLAPIAGRPIPVLDSATLAPFAGPYISPAAPAAVPAPRAVPLRQPGDAAPRARVEGRQPRPDRLKLSDARYAVKQGIKKGTITSLEAAAARLRKGGWSDEDALRLGQALLDVEVDARAAAVKRHGAEAVAEHEAAKAAEPKVEEEPEDPALDIVAHEDGSTPRERAEAAAKAPPAEPQPVEQPGAIESLPPVNGVLRFEGDDGVVRTVPFIDEAATWPKDSASPVSGQRALADRASAAQVSIERIEAVRNRRRGRRIIE